MVFRGFTLVLRLSGNGSLHTCLSEEGKKGAEPTTNVDFYDTSSPETVL